MEEFSAGSDAVADFIERDWARQVMRSLEGFLERLKGELKPHVVEAWRLTELEGMSHDETARRLGISRGNVATARSRVRPRVEAYLQSLWAATE
jgi:DNA-directed RNA polymerase specialized sigma24 family protein